VLRSPTSAAEPQTEANAASNFGGGAPNSRERLSTSDPQARSSSRPHSRFCLPGDQPRQLPLCYRPAAAQLPPSPDSSQPPPDYRPATRTKLPPPAGPPEPSSLPQRVPSCCRPIASSHCRVDTSYRPAVSYLPPPPPAPAPGPAAAQLLPISAKSSQLPFRCLQLPRSFCPIAFSCCQFASHTARIPSEYRPTTTQLPPSYRPATAKLPPFVCSAAPCLLTFRQRNHSYHQ